MKKSHKISAGLAALIAALAVLISLQGKLWLESRIRAELSARGLPELAFSLDNIGLSGITFKDVALPGVVALSIDSITVDYSLLELLTGQLRQINISELRIEKQGMQAVASGVNVVFSAQAQGYGGSWSVALLEALKLDMPVPPLAGQGSWASEPARLAGEFKSADGAYVAAFEFAQKQAPELALSKLQFPWGGGQLAISPTTLVLEPGKALRIPLEVRGVALDIVLKNATGGKAEATGQVSGVVPLIISPQGEFALGKGELKATGQGVLKLSPDVIPGDNQQVADLRGMLGNFHYNQFLMQLTPQPDDKLSILLSLGGNNPDAYNGREVKLNVNLTGDLLDLLQQSILPIADPQYYLKDEHAKP